MSGARRARKQRRDMSETPAPRPLSGRLALDLTQGIAGPYAGRLLAEHGARVIKVEPPGGDWIRQIGQGPGGTSVNFLYYNLGKESVTLDLKTQARRRRGAGHRRARRRGAGKRAAGRDGPARPRLRGGARPQPPAWSTFRCRASA